jgi:hypothetical protein
MPIYENAAGGELPANVAAMLARYADLPATPITLDSGRTIAPSGSIDPDDATPIIVEGPGGVEVEFPAGTSHAVINDAMSKHFGVAGKLTPVTPAAPAPREPAPDIEVEGPDGNIFAFPAGTSEDDMRTAMRHRYPKDWKPGTEPTLYSIEVQGPDNRIFTFPEGTSEETMRAAMRQRYPSPAQPAAATPAPARQPERSYFDNYGPDWNDISERGKAPLAGFAESALNGALMNWGDEAEAAIRAPFSDRDYADILKETRERRAEYAKAWPRAASVGETTGALGTSVLGGIGALRGAGALLGRAPGLLGTMAAEGGISGVLGAAEETGKLEGERDAADYAAAAAEGAKLPAIIGAGVPAAGRVVGATVGPWVSDRVRRLIDRGVRMTPGELVGDSGLPGRVVSRMEQASSSLPVIGDMLCARRREGVESLNRAAWDEALEPAGMRLADDVAMGNEAVGEATEMFNDAYGRVVPQMTARADAPFVRDMVDIRNRLPSSIRPQFMDAYHRHVARNVEEGGLSGRAIQNTIQGLRKEATALRRNPGNAYDIDLADALADTRRAVEQSAERHSAPAVVDEYQSLNSAYRRVTTMRDAASRIGADNSVASPAQLLSAVRAGDNSVGKGAFARGEAPLQGIAADAKSVMGQKLPDSGTPERLALNTLLTGGAGAGIYAAPMAVIPAIGALAALNSQAGNRAFQFMASESPQTRALISRAIRRVTAYGAPTMADAWAD